jgi:hypothetical protein
MFSSLRAKYRAGAKYVLETDIENFYHSIYTHSISWAIDMESKVKKNWNDMNLLGNRLDQLIRNCQDSQSAGIPIGPDTSLLLAEILLTAADESIEVEFGALKGFRYVDDYELCFSNLSDAEKALRLIESTLSDFDLDLNPQKTRIEKLPLPLEDYWATELKLFELRLKTREQERDLISYFSRAFELAKENPNDYVLKYAIPKLRSIQIELDNWSLLQSILLQCLNNEPGTIPYVLEQYVRYSDMGYPIANDQLEETLNSQIKYHAPLGHGSEVAWSLWGAIAFQIMLDSDSASAVSQMEDSIVALLALDAEQRNLFPSSIDTGLWERYMNREDLYGDQWLLSYEANVKGWIPSIGGRDHVFRDSYFSHLKRNDVHFYDESQAARIIPSATLPMPSGYCI